MAAVKITFGERSLDAWLDKRDELMKAANVEEGCRFTKVATRVLYNRRLNAETLRVYLVLRDATMDKAGCYLPQAMIARSLGISVRSVQGAIATLVKEGLIERSLYSKRPAMTKVVQARELPDYEAAWFGGDSRVIRQAGEIVEQVLADDEPQEIACQEQLNAQDFASQQQLNAQVLASLNKNEEGNKKKLPEAEMRAKEQLDFGFDDRRRVKPVKDKEKNDVWELTEHYFAKTRVEATDKERKKQLRLAKAVLENYSLADARMCIDWLMQQEWWRSNYWTLGTVNGGGMQKFKKARRRMARAPGAGRETHDVPEIHGPGSFVRRK